MISYYENFVRGGLCTGRIFWEDFVMRWKDFVISLLY